MGFNLLEIILNSEERIAMPIGVYTGLEITGVSVQDAVTNAQAQTEAVLALHERFQTRIMLTAMDLSAEAETFGCVIRLSETEIPTVIGRKVTNVEEVDRLQVPKAGSGRTSVHLQTANELRKKVKDTPILGGVIGPFSLAGRIFGVSEALELSLSDPDLLIKLLEKTTQFLADYVDAFHESGADGVIMAEPAAGLLSPRGLERFSSQFIKQIIKKTESEQFHIIYHNCGAKLVHLPKILECGAKIFHFGEPMDILSALQQVDSKIVLAGNLDPTSVFFSGTRDEIITKTNDLLNRTSVYQNYVISSGCDIPPQTPVENLEVFYNTVGDISH